MTDPQLRKDAWAYFNDVQNKDMHYMPLLREQDKPAIHLNEATMAEFRRP